MQLYHDDGIIVESNKFKFIIDPGKCMHGSTPVGISHAHSDHAKNHNACIVSTPQTKQLLSSEPEKHSSFPYGHKINLGDCGSDVTMTLHDASHVLGSAQFRISDEQNGEEIVYTGDFRLDQSLLFKGCEVLDCDRLVVETTYGLPEYKFQNPYDVMVEVRKWLNENEGKNIFFGAYSLGKSQEIIWLLNQLGVTPVVHPKIYRIAKIYEENNVKLGDYVSSDSEHGAEMMRHAFVGILSPWLLQQHLFESLQMQNNCRSTSCLVTGWNFRRFGVRKIFHLSDHADFRQLTEYVQQSNAKKVYTVHGFEKQFAGALRKNLGIDAMPLKASQTRLTDFLYSLTRP